MEVQRFWLTNKQILNPNQDSSIVLILSPFVFNLRSQSGGQSSSAASCCGKTLRCCSLWTRDRLSEVRRSRPRVL